MKHLAIFIFILYSISSFAQNRETSTLVKVGDQTPSFSFTNENGNVQTIEDLKGKVVMINFFATWCAPCLTELPHVQSDIYNKYKNNPNFKLLVFGREHSREEVEKFKEQKGYTFPILADPKRKVYSKFASSFIPRNFIIDQNGKIIYSSVGFNEKDFNELKKVLAEALK